MTVVNGKGPLRFDELEIRHLGFLIEGVRRRALATLDVLAARRGWTLGPHGTFPSLRPSHFRLLSLVPAGGCRATDLTLAADMTKQALGQFFSFLAEEGYVTMDADPSDGRARVIRRTPLGDLAVEHTTRLYADLAAEWRALLGAERYEVLEEALTELAYGWEQAPEGTSVAGTQGTPEDAPAGTPAGTSAGTPTEAAGHAPAGGQRDA